MKAKLLSVLVLGFLALGCSGSGNDDPVTPGPDTESRALALYTLTLRPAVTVNGQGHQAQVDQIETSLLRGLRRPAARCHLRSA